MGGPEDRIEVQVRSWAIIALPGSGSGRILNKMSSRSAKLEPPSGTSLGRWLLLLIQTEGALTSRQLLAWASPPTDTFEAVKRRTFEWAGSGGPVRRGMRLSEIELN